MPSSLPSDLDTKNNEKINLSMEANLDCELYRVYSLKKSTKSFWQHLAFLIILP